MRKLELDLNDESAMADAIRQLDRDDALTLNKLIVAHIKNMRERSYSDHMERFSVGDRVTFTDKQGEQQHALVLKLNRKTVGLMTDEGERWNVAPQLLEPEATEDSDDLEFDLFPGGRPNTDTQAQDAVESTKPTPASGNLSGADSASVVPFPTPEGSGTDSTSDNGSRLVGGTLMLPGQITGEGTPYQPVVVVWMDHNEMVVNSSILHPDHLLGELPTLFRETLDKLRAERDYIPQRVRLADSSLIDVLREEFPAIDFQHGDTPELEKLKKSMLEGFEGMGEEITYLSSGATPDAIGAMFRAAAGLYKAKPWSKVPHDQCLIGVSIPSLGINNAVISVIGQKRQNLGFLFFKNLFDHEAYIMAADALGRGMDAELPAYTGFTLEPGKAIGEAQRKEISAHRWKVANNNAYPDLFTPGKQQTTRPVVPEDILLMEVLCLAIPGMFGKLHRPKDAWHSGSPAQSVNLSINASVGQTDVVFHVPFPYEAASQELGMTGSLMGQLMTIGRASDDVDPDVVMPLNSRLMDDYFQSKERRALGDNPAHIVELVLDFATGYMNATVATLQVSELLDILYDIVPRKVAVGPEDAADIIADVRAFYLYLKRVHGLWQAQPCLEALTDEAAHELAEALEDTSNSGFGKAIIAQAGSAGIDISTPAGIEQFMAAVNTGDIDPFGSAVPPSMPLGGFMPPLPASPTAKPVDKKARKNKRKAARKARKKGR